VKLLIFLSLFCATTSAAGAIYQWTDSQGNIQFGEHPPADAEARYIQTPSSPQPAIEQDRQLSDQLQALEQSRALREQQKAETAREKQQAKERKQACDQARQNLANLQLGGHRRMRLPDGTVSYLDAEQKQRYIDISKQNIRDNCD
jgi:hypothetical protein